MTTTAIALAILLLTWVVDPSAGVAGQTGTGGLAAQTLRPYAHVFVAYALAWAVVLGWVVWLGRRWARVEDELDEGER